MEDDELVRAVDACTLPRAAWTHEAHVRLAFAMLRRPALDSPRGSDSVAWAAQRVGERIRGLNAAYGSAGYHETVTQAFVRLIAFRASLTNPPSFEAFARAHPDLLAKRPSPLARHYGAERLALPDAAVRFVEPDRAPLPGRGLRPARADDAAACAAIYARYVAGSPATFEEIAPSPQDMEERIRAASLRLPWLVVEGAGGLEGYAYAHPYRDRAAYRWSIETSVYVHPDRRRRGVGTRLYGLLLAEVERLGHRRALAAITLPNDASAALHERLGFRPSGVLHAVGYKLGRWHDVGSWELALGEDLDPPGEPRPWRDRIG